MLKLILEKWAVYIYALCVLLLFLLKPKFYEPINANTITTILIVYFISVIVHFTSYSNKNWLRLDVFFILGYTIVHLQWPIMYAFSNIIPDNYWRIFVDDRVVNYTSWISVLGGILFLIGFNFYKISKTKIKTIPKYHYKRLLFFTIFSFLIFLLFAGKDFLSGSIYKGEGGSTAGDGISKYFALFYKIGLTILTAITIYQNKDKYKGSLFKWFFGLDKLFLTLIITYILLFLAIGDRGGPLSIILTILIFVGSFVRRFKLYEVVLLTIVGGVLMTIIGLGRNEVSGLGIITTGASKYSGGVSYDATLELANSYRTLNTAIAHVPEEHDYFYGSLWMGNILASVPFAQSLYIEATDLKSYELGSSPYITYLVYGEKAPSGEGTSIVADIYMNFGVIGIAVFMFILGMFFKKLSLELVSPSNIKWIVVAAIFAGLAIYYSRSSYLISLRDIIWSLVFLSLFVKVKRVKTQE